MITLTTILYEGNFRFHLKENPWFREFKSKYVSKKRLLINNVSSTQELENILNDLYDPEEVELVYVKDHAEEVIDYFKLSTKEGDLGYNYTVPYFVNIYTCNTPYFFNVSSDCCVDICIEDSFFEKSIKLLDQDNSYPITALSWEKDWSIHGYPDEITRRDITCVGQWEQVNIPNLSETLEDFWCSEVFWDGIFLANVDKLKSIDYQECSGANKKMAVAPYGGKGSFECRIADYLRYQNIYRPILKSTTQYALHTSSAP
jgi:hypothetical protein